MFEQVIADFNVKPKVHRHCIMTADISSTTRMLSPHDKPLFVDQAMIVRRLDNDIHWIKLYPVDNAIRFAITYPLDSDLSVG